MDEQGVLRHDGLNGVRYCINVHLLADLATNDIKRVLMKQPHVDYGLFTLGNLHVFIGCRDRVACRWRLFPSRPGSINLCRRQRAIFALEDTTTLLGPRVLCKGS
jgi:hypothetical protein